MEKIETIPKTEFEAILDDIRAGETLERFMKSRQFYARCGVEEIFLESEEAILRAYERGEILVKCADDDKKRIIKERIKHYIDDDMSPEEAEKAVLADMKNGIVKFIK